MTVSLMTSVAKKKDSLLYIYIACLCLYMYDFADILWLERIPVSVISLFAIIVSFVKIVQIKSPITSQQLLLCYCFLLYSFLCFFFSNWGVGVFYITVSTLFIVTTSVILLPIDEKKLLFNAISKCMVFIIIISVPAWLLFLAGVDLPHSDVIYHPNGFHEYYDYRFFRLDARNDEVMDLIIPRFQSMFLEPGQFATPCVFLFFLNGARFSRKNLPFIIGIILSFSLVGMVLFLGSIIARKIIIKEKHLFIKFLLIAIVVGGIGYYFTQYINQENSVNEYVFSRLEYDEDKGISGNNRTSSYFDRKYQIFLQSSDRYLGMGQQLKEGYDWTYNCSGYKKFIVRHGLIGFGIFMFFIFLMFFFYKSKPGFFFLAIVVIAFFIRDLLQAPLWLFIAIVGFNILKDKQENPFSLELDNPKSFNREKMQSANLSLRKKIFKDVC